MPNLLRRTGWVLAAFLVFDVIGVVLTVVVDALAVVHRHWESSAPLGYVLWFVVGVFCAVFVYGQAVKEEWESPEGRRAGSQVAILTAVAAVVLGLLSALRWSGVEGVEPVAPDHRGITITYLVTVVLAVGLARFVLFRETAGDLAGRARDKERPVGAATQNLAGNARAKERFVPKRAKSRRSSIPGPLPGETYVPEAPEVFRPAGFWGTLAFVSGVPVLLFLDVVFFVFGSFDFLVRWTGPILTTAVLGGFVWGFAAARWKHPRTALLALHAPLIIGTIFYVFGLLIGGVLFAMGVPEAWAKGLGTVGFWAGFLLGCGAIVGGFLEIFGRPVRPCRRTGRERDRRFRGLTRRIRGMT